MLGVLMRTPVNSAKWSARRAAVQSEKGRPSARGRERAIWSRRSRYPDVALAGAPARGASDNPSTPSA